MENQTTDQLRVILVRHGEAKNWEGNPGNPSYENDLDPQYGLTDEGVKQIQRLSTYFINNDIHADIVTTSPAYRARETALMLGLSLNTILEDIVTDQDFIELNAEECIEFKVDRDNALDSATNRAYVWFDALISNPDHAGKTILCVTHGWPIKAIVERLDPESKGIKIDNASYTSITHNQKTGETMLIYTNPADHL